MNSIYPFALRGNNILFGSNRSSSSTPIPSSSRRRGEERRPLLDSTRRSRSSSPDSEVRPYDLSAISQLNIGDLHAYNEESYASRTRKGLKRHHIKLAAMLGFYKSPYDIFISPNNIPNAQSNKSVPNRNSYEEHLTLLQTGMGLIKDRSRDPIPSSDEASQYISETLNNNRADMGRLWNGTARRLRDLQWGNTLAGALFPNQYSLPGAMSQGEGFIRKLFSGDEKSEMKRFHLAVSRLIYPAMSKKSEDMQNFVQKLMTDAKNQIKNLSATSLNEWEELETIYKLVLTILHSQETLPKVKPYTRNEQELTERTKIAKEKLGELLPQVGRQENIEAWIRNYQQGKAPEPEDGLKETIQKTVLAKNQHNPDLIHQKWMSGELKLKKNLFTRLCSKASNQVTSILHQEFGKNRLVNQAEQTLRGKYPLKNPSALQRLIQSYIQGEDLNEKYSSLIKRAPSDQNSIEDKAILGAYLSNSGKNDFRVDIQHQLDNVRKETMTLKDKFRKLTNLVESYPPEIRESLNSLGKEIIQGETIRAILYGASGAGKTYFVEQACKIAGRPIKLLALTQDGSNRSTKPTDLIMPAPTYARPKPDPKKPLEDLVGRLAEIVLHAKEGTVIFADEGLNALLGNSLVQWTKNTFEQKDWIETAIGVPIETKNLSFIVTGNEDLKGKIHGSPTSRLYDSRPHDAQAAISRFMNNIIEFKEVSPKTADASFSEVLDRLLNTKSKTDASIRTEFEEHYIPIIKETFSGKMQSLIPRFCNGNSMKQFVNTLRDRVAQEPRQPISKHRDTLEQVIKAKLGVFAALTESWQDKQNREISKGGARLTKKLDKCLNNFVSKYQQSEDRALAHQVHDIFSSTEENGLNDRLGYSFSAITEHFRNHFPATKRDDELTTIDELMLNAEHYEPLFESFFGDALSILRERQNSDTESNDEIKEELSTLIGDKLATKLGQIAETKLPLRRV